MRALLAKIIAFVGIAFAGLLPGMAANAYPEGAPWGAADERAAQNCASCHFGQAPARQSAAINLRGLPSRAKPGESYDLTLEFGGASATVVGFLAASSAGAFTSSDTVLETQGRQLRSIEPATGGGPVAWRFQWRAPEASEGGATIFNFAVNGANGDESPLGDQIHFRRFELLTGELE